MRILGVNAAFHDPSAALVVDGRTVAAAEEERFSRRKHGKLAVPFSTWELPEQAMRFCLERGGLRPEDLDAVVYAYDPELVRAGSGDDLPADEWEGLRTLYVQRAPLFLKTALPGLDPAKVSFMRHHVAHAASAFLCAGADPCSVLVLDGRGEATSHLAGRWAGGSFDVLAAQALPSSLGLLYEELTVHLGFHRASDEYKVMAMASHGTPRWLPELRELVAVTEDGGFRVGDVPLADWAPALAPGEDWTAAHADLASSVQARTEEVVIELARWLHERTGDKDLVMAGGVALNCVANSRLWREGPFERVWVQPAAGDAGTALGAALLTAHRMGDAVEPMAGADLGRGWDDAALRDWLETAGVVYEEPEDIAEETAAVLERDGVVAWFQGRSEFGPRALGHRSLLADPRGTSMLERLNDIKGREQFRPVAPMVLAERADEIFEGGPLPSPYMLFVHSVREGWAERIPAVVHVDGTARVQTVDAAADPMTHRMIAAFERRTGVPVVVNTSLNTAGRPMVDDPRDALECFGSAPVDALVLGPFLVRRPGSAAAAGDAAEVAAA